MVPAGEFCASWPLLASAAGRYRIFVKPLDITAAADTICCRSTKQQATDAIVLRRVNYGEADRIVSL